MGGLFSAPKPVVVAPPAQTTAAATAVSSTEGAAAAEAAAREARGATSERTRRGLAGTVATSARGVLTPALPMAARKSLLGE